MPITMVSPYSSYQSRCLPQYPRDFDAVPPECSYIWESKEPQPRWHLTYSPKLVQIMEK